MKHLLSYLIIALIVMSCGSKDGDKEDGGKKHKDKNKGEVATDSQGSSISFPDSSKEFSAWLRAKADHYWTHVNEFHELDAYLSYQGVLAGDSHISNFNAFPVSMNGQETIQYLNVDFDDGGQGPFALDIARFISVTKATKKKVKTSAIIDAYVLGLHNQQVEAPSKVKEFLAMTVKDYHSKMHDYISKKVKGSGLEEKPGKIEKYHGPITKEQVQAILPSGVNVMDIATRPHDHGSSRDAVRLYVLARDTDRHYRLFELKEWLPSALQNYGPQADTQTWYKQMVDTFWNGNAIDQLVTMPEAKLFWLREKRLKLIDVPYTSDSTAAVAFVQGLAVYDAYLLGKAHGQQTQGLQLAAKLNSPEEVKAFKNAVKLLAKKYLNLAWTASLEDPLPTNEDL